MINWDKAELQDYELAGDIAVRAATILNKVNVASLQMDIVAVHINGCKLKMAEMLKADTSNFMHDVCGIAKHLDRATGKLRDCFVPRYAC